MKIGRKATSMEECSSNRAHRSLRISLHHPCSMGNILPIEIPHTPTKDVQITAVQCHLGCCFHRRHALLQRERSVAQTSCPTLRTGGKANHRRRLCEHLFLRHHRGRIAGADSGATCRIRALANGRLFDGPDNPHRMHGYCRGQRQGTSNCHDHAHLYDDRAYQLSLLRHVLACVG
jgi:hypothetical protein